MTSLDSPLVISDDDDEPVAPVPAVGPQQPVAAEEPNLREEVPDWVPDGWTVEACRLDDGTINWYYTCPVTDFTFTMKSEVMQYIHSGAAEHALQAKATLDDESTLQDEFSTSELEGRRRKKG